MNGIASPSTLARELSHRIALIPDYAVEGGMLSNAMSSLSSTELATVGSSGQA